MKQLALSLLIATSYAWAQVPQSRHIWIVTEENHSYESVIGNSGMPYFNSLAGKYSLATQYYAEQHNSISALMWLVAGQPVTSNNQTTSCFNLNNIARHLIAQGFTWRSYQEDLPYPGFTGISSVNYVRRHNPIIDFTDTCAPAQSIHSVPFTQLAADIANHSTPNYAYITPNLLNDGHDGPLPAADVWLSRNVPAILALPEFQPGGDGILFVVWDEGGLASNGVTQDNRCSARVANGCGGRIATLVIGPQVKPGYKSPVRYDHANLLRTVCDAMGLKDCPGAGSVASPMSDFFNSVAIATPFANAIVASPVHVVAKSNQLNATTMQVYVDNALKYQVSGGSVDTYVPMSLGSHILGVQSSDATGGIHKRNASVSVQTEAVVILNPAPNSVVGSPVPISAAAGGQRAVSKMQLYVDGNSKFQSSGNTLNVAVPLSLGNHAVAVQATDTSGALTTTTFHVVAAGPSIQIVSPLPNSSFYAPMYVSATTQDPTPVIAVQIYADNALVYEVSGTGVQASLPISQGTHGVVVQAWNQSGATYKKSLSVNVVPVPITILSPPANATVTSPVAISASAPTNSPVQTMQIYVDNALAYQTSGQTVNTSLPMASGLHFVVVKGWDGSGNNWFTSEHITVQ